MRENYLKRNEETLIYILNICDLENEVLMMSIDKRNKNVRVSTLNHWKGNNKTKCFNCYCAQN